MKRLYRDKSNEIIAGVCSGIANYLDIDPTVVRLLFVLFFFLAGGGLWIYLVLWVIMPEDPAYKKDEAAVDVKEKLTEPKKVATPKAKPATKPAAKKAQAKKPAAKTSTTAKATPTKKAAPKAAAKKTPPEKSGK